MADTGLPRIKIFLVAGNGKGFAVSYRLQAARDLEVGVAWICDLYYMIEKGSSIGASWHCMALPREKDMLP